jgi:cell wall-associated NlpC family hydrolase
VMPYGQVVFPVAGLGDEPQSQTNARMQTSAPVIRGLHPRPWDGILRAMGFKIFLRAGFIACALAAQSALADEPPAQVAETESGVVDYRDGIQPIIDRAQDLIGIRYRRRGDKPQTGFDCSGFVGYVFREGVGLLLPRASHEISKTGTPISKDELKAGDLVFFNTMRRAFSHVGIYLGDDMFVHAPRAGDAVRIDRLQAHYWAKRYSGARRMFGSAAPSTQR